MITDTKVDTLIRRVARMFEMGNSEADIVRILTKEHVASDDIFLIVKAGRILSQ